MSNRMTLVPKPDYIKLARDLVGKAELLEYATEIAVNIKDRTVKKQVDYKGTPFKKYTKDYALMKGVSRSDVDLMGINAGTRMMNNMKTYAKEKESVIYFGDANKNELAYKNNKYRKFFEFSNGDEKKIIKMYEKDIDKAIRKWERS